MPIRLQENLFRLADALSQPVLPPTASCFMMRPTGGQRTSRKFTRSSPSNSEQSWGVHQGGVRIETDRGPARRRSSLETLSSSRICYIDASTSTIRFADGMDTMSHAGVYGRQLMERGFFNCERAE